MMTDKKPFISDKAILRELLEFEINNFSSKLCLTDDKYEFVSYELTLRSLNLLKSVANNIDSDFQQQIVMTIISLLWTHSSSDTRENLRQIITPILSSIGFSPSNMMLDNKLRHDGIYSPLSSYIDKMRVFIYDRMNQVSIGAIEYTLTTFQTELWHAINNNRLIGISAPTSAGKSFLIYLKIIDMIKNGCYRFVYVVPTLSLISQVTSDLSKLLKTHGFFDIDILNSYEEQLERFIYVVTQERAIILFSENGINELDLLVVDEVQNIEKVANEGEDRSKILYDVLIDVRNDTNVGKIILSGPRLKNIGGLGFRIFGKVSEEKQTDSSPVLNITYSISEKNNEHYLKLYSTIFEHPIEKKITNIEHINGLGQVMYTPKFNEYLHKTLECLPNEVNIIFSPTSAQARKSAENFFKNTSNLNNPKLHSLSDYFKSSVHQRYSLANFVESGIAYHTGKTPMHVRKSLEHAASNELINYLFCTTTLMQGVNLPAKNIIIRNPYLFTKRTQDSIKLSAYEFANLRGRAGRLLTDFIGRTIVLDESSFNDEDKTSDSKLFSDEYKDINTGYQGIYEQNSYFIDDALGNDSLINDAPSKGLITHIRQMIYRHGSTGGASRLKDVGVNIHPNLISKVAYELKNLSIPRDIVLSNRYWDPMDLEQLYNIYNDINQPLPTSIFEGNLYQNLLNWMSILKQHFPYYFNRYLGRIDSDTYLYGIAKSAESWMREKPLFEILSHRFGTEDNSIDEKIDTEIEKLSKYVSYGLPMLLKPVYDLNKRKTSIISFIELGMHTPIARYLADRGVPRETAIKVSALHGTKENLNLDMAFIRKKLNYWELQHMAHLL